MRQTAEECLDSIQYDAFGADGVDRMAQTDKQSFKVIVAGFFNFVALDTNEVQDQFFSRDQIIQIETERATFCASSSAVSSKAMKTPGSPNCVAPRTRNSIAKSVLPQPALPQISVGRPRGSPPPVISSSPWMPTGALGSERVGVRFADFVMISNGVWSSLLPSRYRILQNRLNEEYLERVCSFGLPHSSAN